MPRLPTLSRRWRRVVIIVLLTPLAALLVGNLALNLPPLKPWLTNKVSVECQRAGIGSDAKLGWVSYWPWSGARIHNVRVGDPDAPLLRVDVRAKFGLLRFVGGVLGGGGYELSELVFEEPEIRFPLPEAREVASVPPPPGSSLPVDPASPPPTEPGPAPERPAEPAPDGEVKPAPPLTSPDPAPAVAAGEPARLSIGKLVVKGGAIVIGGAPGERELARVDSFEFEFEPGSSDEVRFAGGVRIGSVSLLGRRVAEEGTAEVEVKAEGFEINEVILPVEGGELRGIVKVENTPGWPFVAEFRAAGLDLAKLSSSGADADLALTLLAGKANGIMRLRGWVEVPGETRGRIKVATEGLQARFADGRAIEFLGAGESPGSFAADAGATLDIAGGNLFITAASLRSGGVWIKAAGKVERDGSLDLAARLFTAGEFHAGFERSAKERTPGVPSMRFRWLPGTDWHFHDFRVRGQPATPVADFWQRGSLEPLAEIWRQFAVRENALAAGAGG